MYNQPNQSPETLISLDCDSRIPTNKQSPASQQQQPQQQQQQQQSNSHVQQSQVQQATQDIQHQQSHQISSDEQRMTRNGSNWEPLTPPQ